MARSFARPQSGAERQPQYWKIVVVLPMFCRMSKALPTDFMAISPTVKVMSDGRLCIRFEGGMFPSLVGKLFGLTLTPETTREQAQALAAQLEKHCPHLFVAFLDYEGLSEEERLTLTRMDNNETGLLDPLNEDEEGNSP